MGMEILWFRHFSILLGEFRAVFALLLAIILLGIGAGSLAGAYVQRRIAHPAQTLIVIQGMFVAATLLGSRIGKRPMRSAMPLSRHRGAQPGALTEIWFNARPILLIAGAARAAHGIRVPAGQRDRAAHRGPRRAPRRRAVPREHVRRGLRIARDRFPVAADARDSASATVLMVAAGLAIVALVSQSAGSASAGTAVGGTRPTAPVGSAFRRTFRGSNRWGPASAGPLERRSCSQLERWLHG